MATSTVTAKGQVTGAILLAKPEKYVPIEDMNDAVQELRGGVGADFVKARGEV